jgi:hypothetical protein
MRIRLFALSIVVTAATTACSTPTAPRQTPAGNPFASDTTGRIVINPSGYIVSTGGHGQNNGVDNSQGNSAGEGN